MEFGAGNGRLQPGFRFNPTDEELVMFYLKRKVLGKRLDPTIVEEVDIYKFHPQDLRELSCFKKDLCWYFFCPRGKKYGSGARVNRATDTGYWKATGNDRTVSYQKRTVGKIKTLVFHLGKPPKGERTDWVMHEFRLDDKNLADAGVCQDSFALCKIFKKSGLGPKNGEQYGAPFIEQEWDDGDEIPNTAVMVPAIDPNQSISGMTNVTEPAILVQVPDVDQTRSISSVDIAADPNGWILPVPMPMIDANLASTSTGNPLVNPVADYDDYDPAVFLVDEIYPDPAIYTPLVNPAADYDPLVNPAADYDHPLFTVDEIFADLGDLDSGFAALQGNKFTWESLYDSGISDSGLGLTDLDE